MSESRLMDTLNNSGENFMLVLFVCHFIILYSSKQQIKILHLQNKQSLDKSIFSFIFDIKEVGWSPHFAIQIKIVSGLEELLKALWNSWCYWLTNGRVV